MIKIDSVNLAAIVLAMRRLFIVFMLCLLPVQVSWAAVADYCAHEPAGDAQHFAHHDDEHATPLAALDGDLPNSDADPVKSNLLHDHSHLAGFIGLLTETTLTAAIVPTLPVLQSERQVYSSQILDRPERPKWHPLA